MGKQDYWYDPLMQPVIDYQKKQERKERLLSKIGAIKVYGDIARYYLSLVQFILILWGFLEVMQFGLMLNIVISLGGFIGLMLIVIFHVRYIMPYEYDYLNRRDKVKMETLKAVKK